jgi:hypothetical protein
MSSVLVSVMVATSMSTFKVKWLLNDSRNDTTRVSIHRPVTETVVRDNVEFPIKSISMGKGTGMASTTKSNQDHHEKGQSSRWTIIKVFTHILSTASSKRSSRSAHRASCITQQRSCVRRRERRPDRIISTSKNGDCATRPRTCST